MKVSHHYYLAISGLRVGKQKTVDWDSWRILNPVEKGGTEVLSLDLFTHPLFVYNDLTQNLWQRLSYVFGAVNLISDQQKQLTSKGKPAEVLQSRSLLRIRGRVAATLMRNLGNSGSFTLPIIYRS